MCIRDRFKTHSDYWPAAKVWTVSGKLRAITAQLVPAAEIQESRPCGKPLFMVDWNGKARRLTYQLPSASWVSNKKHLARSTAGSVAERRAPTRSAYRAWPVA